MKRSLFVLTAVFVLAAGCQREKMAESGVDGSAVDVTFNIDLQGIGTKAFGDGTTAKDLQVLVYSSNTDGHVYQDAISKNLEGAFSDALTAKVTLKLIRGANYDIVFWAQAPGCTAYTVDTATGTLTVAAGGAANDEMRDAFYAAWSQKVDAAGSYDIQMKRPLAQVNVLASEEDFAVLSTYGKDFAGTDFTMTAPTKLDLFTGKVSEPGECKFTMAAIDPDAVNVPGYETGYKYVAMNYVLAGEESDIQDVSFNTYGTGEVVISSRTIPNVPFQRNCRTVIQGRVFSADGSFSVTLLPEFDGEEIVKMHEYVDMGNGLLWATCNIGADNPWDRGDYFDWGGIQPYYQEGYSQENPCKHWIEGKDGYNWKNYSFMKSGNIMKDFITKYTFADGYTDGIWYDGNKFIGDGKTTFADYNFADDAARQIWKGTWRIPTDEEWQVLLDENYYTWEWTADYLGDGSNHAGRIITRKEGTGPCSGNSIFLPTTGFRADDNLLSEDTRGYYWSSSLCMEENSSLAWYVVIRSDRVTCARSNRSDGQCVRPVMDKYAYVDMGTVVINGVEQDMKWATCNVGAESPEEYGSLFAWGETAPKEIYLWDTYAFGNDGPFTHYTGDDDNTLRPQDDAATVNWGPGWRTPTDEECRALTNNQIFKWEWTSVNGVNGILVTRLDGPCAGNNIFFPAVGCESTDDYGAGTKGYYWSSTLYPDINDYSADAYTMCFNRGYFYMGLFLRCDGLPVRAVKK